MVEDKQPTDLGDVVSQTDWQALSERLLLFAAARLRQMRWRGTLQGAVPGGLEPHDLVLNAIRKFLHKERRKPPEVSLFSFLCGVIRSDISHLATSLENRSTLTVDEGADELPRAQEGSMKRAPSPFDQIAMQEERQALLARLEGDPLACQVARLIIDEELKPNEIARALEQPVTEVYNAIKRLRRTLAAQGKAQQSAITLQTKETRSCLKTNAT